MKRRLFFPATLALVISFSVSAYATDIEEGQSIFNGSAGCSVCHKANDDKLVGPGLAGNAKLHTDAWLMKWLADPQKTWAENDPETKAMKKRLGKLDAEKTAMKRRKFLSQDEIKLVIAYLKTL